MSLNIIIDADVTQASQTISKFSYEIKKSFGSINTVIDKTATGFQYGTNKMADATKSFTKASQNSLTALSLTLQDLPFGFIGIQNNLPGIIQGFGQMSTVAQTGASVMSQLGSALIGPAGLFLAFSAVTSIVTSLVMEYGSLGEAMNAIFGKTNELSGKIKELSESYKEFNKQLKTSQEIVGQEKASTSSQVTELQTLSKIILDQTKSYNERNAALNRLKEINKDYFGNLTLETLKTNTLTDAVTGYKDSLVQGAITKGFQQQLTKTNLELSKQQILLEQLQDATDAAKRAPVRINRVTGEIDTQAIKDAESAYNKQLQVVNALKKSKSALNKEIENSVKAQIALRGPVDAATAAFEKQKKADEELKKQKGVRIGTIIDKGELGPGNLLDTAAAFAAYVKGNINIQKASIDKILRERNSYRRKEIEAEIFTPKKIDKIAAAPMSKELELLLGQFQLFQAALAENMVLMNQTFFMPLENAFMNLFETGKFGFKAFADAVLKQIQQLVSKIIATGIISLIANIMSGGLAGAAGGIGGVLARVGGDILKAIGIGGVANPSFGGVGPGSLGMSGQVNVVLRGSDLVGSLNRTNATINRVG